MHVFEAAHDLQSAHLEREVKISILMPAEAPPTDVFHLLLLNDGQELHNLRVREALDAHYKKDLLVPVVVAAPHAGERKQEYGTAGRPDIKGRGSRAGAYTAFILEELMPYIREHSGVERFASTAFAGCSLGALSALDIVWNHPEHFDIAGAFSGSFWWRDAHLRRGYRDDKNRIMHQIIRSSDNKPQLRFFFQTGTLDETADRNKNGIIDSIDDTVDLIRELESKGYKRPDDIKYMEIVGGRHDVPTWAGAMPHFLQWAFGR